MRRFFREKYLKTTLTLTFEVIEGNEENELVQTLADVLTSDDVRKFIEENYTGAVVPAF